MVVITLYAFVCLFHIMPFICLRKKNDIAAKIIIIIYHIHIKDITHGGQVTPHGVGDFDQHWWHQAIAFWIIINKVQWHSSGVELQHRPILPLYIGFDFRSPGQSYDYRQTSNIRRTKSQNWNASPLVLRLSWPNPLKPGVLSRELRCSWSSVDKWLTILLHIKALLILKVWRYPEPLK